VTDATSVRVDKWLWAVRLYSTRTAAAEACAGGHVRVGEDRVKSARPVRVGDEVHLSGHPRVAACRVVRLVERRVGAPVAATCYEVLEAVPRPGPSEDWIDVAVRERGAGRPTKRDRRLTDDLRGRRR
jgi:ribosome-associated heat shock protein Hsp15